MSVEVTLALIALTIAVLGLLTVASVKYLGGVLAGGAEHAETDEPGGRGPGRAV